MCAKTESMSATSSSLLGVRRGPLQAFPRRVLAGYPVRTAGNVRVTVVPRPGWLWICSCPSIEWTKW